MIPFCPMDTKHIRYLEVGDTFHETGYGRCLNLKVIDKPMNSGYQWTWKAINLDTYEIVDYLVTENSPCYINLYFTEETYYRLTRLGLGFSKISGTTSIHTLPSITLSKDNIYQTIKDANKKLRQNGRTIPTVELKGLKFDKLWMDEMLDETKMPF